MKFTFSIAVHFVVTLFVSCVWLCDCDPVRFQLPPQNKESKLVENPIIISTNKTWVVLLIGYMETIRDSICMTKSILNLLHGSVMDHVQHKKKKKNLHVWVRKLWSHVSMLRLVLRESVIFIKFIKRRKKK